jgi:hypothetical protein
MAEPYVPIAELTTYQGIMTEIEVTSNASETNADALELATANALIAKTSAEAALDSKFNFLLLVGC